MVGHTDTQRLMFLEALEAAGVDNWEGFDEALVIYRQWIKEEQEHFDDEDN